MIGDNIRIFRRLRGLSQKDLADLSEISPGNISHLEAGKRLPSIENLYKLADALNISVLNLLLDEREIKRFYVDESLEAYYPNCTKLKARLDQLLANNASWADAKRIAILDLDE